MIIDIEKCMGCGECAYTCPVEAIALTNGVAEIHGERCVECGNCLRSADCPVDAIFQDALAWPRILRKCFSDNQFQWPDNLRYTLGFGRGTEECKTNDRTGKFTRDEVGILVDLGRPGTGASLGDAEKIAQSMIAAGAVMAEDSPFSGLLEDKEKGLLPGDIGQERVLSCVIEAKVGIEFLEKALLNLRQVSSRIDSVFSLGLITRVSDDFSIPIRPVIERLGIEMRPSAKINVGLGKPLSEE